jgi:putative membrane protein
MAKAAQNADVKAAFERHEGETEDGSPDSSAWQLGNPIEVLRFASTIAPTTGGKFIAREESMTTRSIIGASLAIALSFSSAALAQDKGSQKFLKDAIEGNLAEVKMGELAQKNAGSDAVRSYGQMLEKDHTEANQKASAAANSLGISPPTEPNRKQKADYDRMAKLNGAQFDREFAKHMVADHKKDIREYEKQAKKNDAAGSYANETLPTLRKHLQEAQALTGQTKSSRTSASPPAVTAAPAPAAGTPAPAPETTTGQPAR